jgi:transcriptional regulator GlxA family with amidase domain
VKKELGGHIVSKSGHGAFTQPSRYRVALLVFDGLSLLELSIVQQRLGSARSADGEPLYEVVICALEPGEIRCADVDCTINVAHGFDAVVEADTVIVA